MATKTYKAKVKLPNGSWQDVTVQADNAYKAKGMLEALWGKGNLWGPPTEVR